MALPTFKLEKQILEVKHGESILDASLRQGVNHAHACGGKALCSTCRVEVTEGSDRLFPRNELEQEMAQKMRFPSEVRLACQTQLVGGISIRRLIRSTDEVQMVYKQIREGKAHSAGELKRLAILFADIRGFTTLSESLAPYDVIHALNYYFHKMSQVIQRNNGYVDNYIGDGLIALFGLDNPDTAPLDATKAALNMLEGVEELADHFESLFHQRLKIGVGIHYGEVVVGYVGGTKDGSVTVIGDTVNTASRIESMTKEAGVKLLVSEDVLEHIGEVALTGCSASVSIRGKSEEYKLHEVVGLKAIPHDASG